MTKARASAWAVSLCFHSLVLAWAVHWSATGGGGSSPASVADGDGPLSIEISSEPAAQSAAPELPALSPPEPEPEPAIMPPVTDLVVTRAPAKFSIEAPLPQALSLHPTSSENAAPSKPARARGGKKGRSGDFGTGQGSGRGSYAPPRYLHSPAPEYPLEAKRERIQGVVLLWVKVSEDGRPVSVSLKRSSGNGRLDEAAIRTVRKWLFEPARLGEKAVAAAVEVPVRFRLAG